MKPDPDSFHKAILNAHQAMLGGFRQTARGWAMQAVALDPDSEEPWLYLAALASPRASLNYLEQALKINPNSQRARKGMQWAEARLKREQEEQSSRKANPPIRNLVENSEFVGIARDVAWKPAAPVPKNQPQLPGEPAEMVARSAPSDNRNIPKPVAGYRWSRSVKRFSSRWQNWIGVLIVCFFVLVALAAPLISPNNSKSRGAFIKVSGFRSSDLQPRSPAVVPPLGTLPGQLDVFHALTWGTRDALSFGLEVVILAALFGCLFGAIAGYAGGVINSFMSRITDAFLAFPIIAGVVFLNQLWASTIAAAGGMWDYFTRVWVLMKPGVLTSPIQALFQSINPLVLVLILFSWMPYARITNAVVITLKQVEFIQAARAIGARPSRIILRHLIPNSVAPSIVLAARDVGGMVIIQAAFTFIGLDGSSTWGNILAMGRNWILGPGGGIFTYWWVYVPATLALVLFGIGWNLLGDGLSELLDPRDN
jgi:peptide/nickel transport system permease protein